MMHHSSNVSKNDSDDVRGKLVQLLNQQLAATADLRLQTEHAHYNARGPYVEELSSLFDGLVRDLRHFTDLIAGRIKALGGHAIVTVRVVAQRSHLCDYPLDALDASEHLQALLSSYSRYSLVTRKTMKAVMEFRESETAELLHEISTAIEKDLWLLEAYLEGITIGIHGGKLPRWTPAFERGFRNIDRNQRIASTDHFESSPPK